MFSSLRARGRLVAAFCAALLGALPASAQQNISTPEAVRFLEQCTFGPTKTDIDRVKSVGYEAFLDEQFAATPSNYNFTVYTPYSLAGMRLRFFQNAVRKPDQLRQRVAFALSQVLVVSGGDNVFPGEHKAPAVLSYYHTLLRHAFGNYRTLLMDLTLNPAMGAYLNMVNNAKGNVAQNSQPNENYARELLQLFSLGVYKLNRDGSVQTDGLGNPVPTYDNPEVTAFARVFTGWTYAPRPGRTFNGFQYSMNFTGPMALWAPNHDTGAKTLLNGIVLPALPGGIPTNTNNQQLQDYAVADLNAAIDNIFAHQNIAPFVSLRLIQHLVTANPSPAYVDRVAQKFENNGSGVRGDMKAVVKAVLLDAEARTASTASSTNGYGHWRSGILYITGLLRAMDAQGDLAGFESWARDFRQDVFAPPSVFSFYKPETRIATGVSPNIVFYSAPEVQTLTTETAIRRINFVNTLLYGSVGSNISGYTGVTGLANLAEFEAVALDTTALVNLVAERLLHGEMTPAMRTQITGAVNAITGTTATDRTNRAKAALYLAFASNEYQVVR
jgi:uncharacterized protein (DUF1800 family)